MMAPLARCDLDVYHHSRVIEALASDQEVVKKAFQQHRPASFDFLNLGGLHDQWNMPRVIILEDVAAELQKLQRQRHMFALIVQVHLCARRLLIKRDEQSPRHGRRSLARVRFNRIGVGLR